MRTRTQQAAVPRQRQESRSVGKGSSRQRQESRSVGKGSPRQHEESRSVGKGSHSVQWYARRTKFVHHFFKFKFFGL